MLTTRHSAPCSFQRRRMSTGLSAMPIWFPAMAPIIREDIERYVEEHTTPVADALQALDRETHEQLSSPQLLSGPVAGRLLEALVFSIGAQPVLEIGTY